MWSWGKCLLYNVFAQSSAQPACCLWSVRAVLQLQREPHRNEVVPFTLRMGRDEHRHVQKTEKQLGVQYCKLFLFHIIILFCLFFRYWLQLTVFQISVLSANCLHLMVYQPKKHPHLLFKTSSKQLLIQGEKWVNSGFKLNLSLTLVFFFVLLSFCVGVTFYGQFVYKEQTNEFSNSTRNITGELLHPDDFTDK